MNTPEDKIRAWVEANVGGTVERVEEQARWRGGWWVDVRRDGATLPLYVREERKEDYPPWPIEHEANVLRVLERNGVPVPHVYGICEDPHATVMEAMPGVTSFAGVAEESERVAILRDYAEVMARMHAIDPQELVATGVAMPATDRERLLPCFALCESMYLKGKKRPDPRIEFLRKWVYANLPTSAEKVSVIAVDSGQFLHQDGKVRGLFDFEYGCLGDPVIDLAFVPRRGSIEGMGDMTPFFARYAELTGASLDLHHLTFHTVWWSLVTPMIITADLHEPPSHATYYEYIGWYVCTMYSALEALADLKGLDLDRTYSDRGYEGSRWAALFDVMLGKAEASANDGSYAAHELAKSLEFAQRMDRFHGAEAEFFSAASALTGVAAANWREADQALEDFVGAAGPEHDEALIRLFHRWCIVQLNTLLKGFSYNPLERAPVQKFSEILGNIGK